MDYQRKFEFLKAINGLSDRITMETPQAKDPMEEAAAKFLKTYTHQHFIREPASVKVIVIDDEDKDTLRNIHLQEKITPLINQFNFGPLYSFHDEERPGSSGTSNSERKVTDDAIEEEDEVDSEVTTDTDTFETSDEHSVDDFTYLKNKRVQSYLQGRGHNRRASAPVVFRASRPEPVIPDRVKDEFDLPETPPDVIEQLKRESMFEKECKEKRLMMLNARRGSMPAIPSAAQKAEKKVTNEKVHQFVQKFCGKLPPSPLARVPDPQAQQPAGGNKAKPIPDRAAMSPHRKSLLPSYILEHKAVGSEAVAAPLPGDLSSDKKQLSVLQNSSGADEVVVRTAKSTENSLPSADSNSVQKNSSRLARGKMVGEMVGEKPLMEVAASFNPTVSVPVADMTPGNLPRRSSVSDDLDDVHKKFGVGEACTDGSKTKPNTEAWWGGLIGLRPPVDHCKSDDLCKKTLKKKVKKRDLNAFAPVSS